MLLCIMQGCTSYFTDNARNIFGREVGAAVGLWGLCPNGVQGQSPWLGDHNSKFFALICDDEIAYFTVC